MSDRITLPPIEPFRGELLSNSKATALKPLEEAAEAYGAWQKAYEQDDDPWDYDLWDYENVLYECADVIQATVNLACAVVGRKCKGCEKPFSTDEVARALSDAYEVVHAGNGSRGRHE